MKWLGCNLNKKTQKSTQSINDVWNEVCKKREETEQQFIEQANEVIKMALKFFEFPYENVKVEITRNVDATYIKIELCLNEKVNSLTITDTTKYLDVTNGNYVMKKVVEVLEDNHLLLQDIKYTERQDVIVLELKNKEAMS